MASSITRCTLTDNENGILTSGDKDAELLIENSEFGNNGFGDGLSHNLYVGVCLTDETGGRASYELGFSNKNPTLISFGAEGYKWPRNELYLVGNTLADDRPSGGKWMAVRTDTGAEPVNLVVKALNNVLVGAGELGAALSAPAAGNRDVAGVKPFVLDIRNNINVDWDVFAQASRQDYRLKNPVNPPLKPVPPGSANGVDLSPKREYLHPRQTWGV